MKEIWKNIPNYENRYQVSNLGNVKSLLKSSDGIILKPTINKHGYNTVCLRKDGKGKTLLVHRLVALAFIPNPNNFNVVNHKDENRLNNCVSNLEWCTSQYNFDYKNSRLRQGISHGKPVQQLTLDDIPVAIYYSAEFASIINDCDPSSICKCCKGERQIAGGYHWRYLDKTNIGTSEPLFHES